MSNLTRIVMPSAADAAAHEPDVLRRLRFLADTVRHDEPIAITGADVWELLGWLDE